MLGITDKNASSQLFVATCILTLGAKRRSHLGQPVCCPSASAAVRLLQRREVHAEVGRLLQEGQMLAFSECGRLLQRNAAGREEFNGTGEFRPCGPGGRSDLSIYI